MAVVAVCGETDSYCFCIFWFQMVPLHNHLLKKYMVVLGVLTKCKFLVLLLPAFLFDFYINLYVKYVFIIK